MPRHRQVTTCRKSGGLSKHCSCEHCALHVCAVCGAGEGTLTTDCPGAPISGDRLEEILETNLDFTDDRGWHLIGRPRSPRFESPAAPSAAAHGPLAAVAQGRIVGCVCGWRTPQSAADSDDAYSTHAALAELSPTIDWTAIGRMDELTQKAFAWVLADRICEDRSAALTRVEDAKNNIRLLKGHHRDLHTHLERDFKIADQRAQKCDDEFRQAARRLVTALEEAAEAAAPVDQMELK